MKNLLLIIGIIILLWSCTNETKTAYELVWSDDFEYEGIPDSTKWSFDTKGNEYGWGNHELQYYTEAELKNAIVSDGTLKIIAHKESKGGKAFTSSRLVTKHKGDWLYGKIEVSAKLPDGRGLWPAIWMLATDKDYGGWPKSGEIDIMENVGYDPDTILATVHTKSFNHMLGTQKGGKISLPDNRDVFHVYSIEWDSITVKAYVDGKRYFNFDKPSDNPNEWPFDKRFYLILNVAVGGDWGGEYGIDDTIFPATMEIDYVRVYQEPKK